MNSIIQRTEVMNTIIDTRDDIHQGASSRRRVSNFVAIVTGLLLLGPFKSAHAAKSANITTFWAIGDVPYSNVDKKMLGEEMSALGDSGMKADFLIHLGDIKTGGSPCIRSSYTSIASEMKRSPVPVFMIVGDNEFNDCDNIAPEKALTMWRESFVRYDRKHWKHHFKVKQMSNRPEVFSFVNKRTLFIGLNFVGGFVHDKKEWEARHTDQLKWVTDLMSSLSESNSIHSVVIFGHADPGGDHANFINPFVVFLRKTFSKDIPVLYLGGDSHKWAYNPVYHNEKNWLRVRLTRGLVEPVVRIIIDPDGKGRDPTKAFKVERFL